jgi:hypothetical protein
MDHMKDNFGELLAAISGSKEAAAPQPPSSRRVQQPQPQQNEYQNQQHQHQYQQNDYPTQQQQQQYVWQAQPMPQLQQQQQPMPMPQLQQHQQQQQPYGYGGYVPMPMPPMPMQPMPISQQQQPQQHSNPIIHQQHQYAPGVQQAPSNINKGLEAKTTKKSFPVVFITISLIVLGFGVLAVWYYSKKNVLADSVPLPEEAARLPPPKLFLVSEKEETEKLLQDSHVIENLERYLSSPPTTTTVESKPNAKTISKPVSKNRFTKLSDVIAEEEEEQKPLEEIEVEVNGFKKKMPKRIDSDSPEINDFMKRREQAEKENLKWIESQRLSGSSGSNEEI